MESSSSKSVKDLIALFGQSPISVRRSPKSGRRSSKCGSSAAPPGRGDTAGAHQGGTLATWSVDAQCRHLKLTNQIILNRPVVKRRRRRKPAFCKAAISTDIEKGVGGGTSRESSKDSRQVKLPSLARPAAAPRSPTSDGKGANEELKTREGPSLPNFCDLPYRVRRIISSFCTLEDFHGLECVSTTAQQGYEADEWKGLKDSFIEASCQVPAEDVDMKDAVEHAYRANRDLVSPQRPQKVGCCIVS